MSADKRLINKAFQDYMPNNNCWGCGPNNEEGLQLKSYWDNGELNTSLMRWKPESFYKAGPDHILNGGIISTLIDCHSICTAVAQKAKDEKVQINDEIWFVTGTLKVEYLKPTFIDYPVTLNAKVIEKGKKKSIISCSLFSNGIKTAHGQVVGILVSSEWRNNSSH